MGKIISFSTNKGGVLKTSITSSLAGLLSLNGKKVLIIDTDNQGNISVSFGKNPDEYKDTLYDVLLKDLNPKDAIHNVYKNIDVLPSNDDMGFFEFDIVSNLDKYKDPLSMFEKFIPKIKDDYDYILIDCPPNLGLILGNVLRITDEIIIPFQPEPFSMRSIQKIVNQINNFKVQQNPSLKVNGVIGTLVDGRTNLHTTVLQECRRFCLENDIRMFDTVIPKSIRAAASVAYEGLPVTLTEKDSVLFESYVELFKEAFEDGER